jgi:hypothetical protein
VIGSWKAGTGSVKTGYGSAKTATGICAPFPDEFETDGASFKLGKESLKTATTPPACTTCGGPCQSYSFSGTETTVLGGSHLLAAIPIDFSCLPNGSLKITFSTGDVRYDNGEDAGSSVQIVASASPLFGVGDTTIWYTGPPAPNDGFPADWNPILDVVNGTGSIGFPWPMTSFANPNHAGIGYIKLYGNAGSGSPGFETGFRNYAFQICAA